MREWWQLTQGEQTATLVVDFDRQGVAQVNHAALTALLERAGYVRVHPEPTPVEFVRF